MFLKAVAPAPSDGAGDEGDGEDGEEQPRRSAFRREWDEHWDTQAKRDSRAALVASLARTFVEKLAQCVPAEALNSVYIHFLTCHIGAHVARLGPLWFWSGQGLENKNHLYKMTQRGTAQRGKTGAQNGGRKNAEGLQARQVPGYGRVGATVEMVIHGEDYGGMSREGRRPRDRHGRPDSML